MLFNSTTRQSPPILEVEDPPDVGTTFSAPVTTTVNTDPISGFEPGLHIPTTTETGGTKCAAISGPARPPASIDDHTQFWATYDRVTGAFDREILDAWNKSLDVLLIFGALFSAINTAFIIESYKGLQPDAAEVTNELLRLLITHRSDNDTISAADLSPGHPSEVGVQVNAIFFSSLSFSLSAAFGAVTAKQWLTEYAGIGGIIAPHEQGRRRQEKFKGLKEWHLRLIIELLPLLLQTSMFLFLVGVAFFLWPLSRNISILEIALSGAGLGIYITSILIGIFVPTSPFQTPVSKYAPRYLAQIRSLFQFKPRDMVRRSKEYWRSTIRAHMGNADSLSLASGRSLTRSEIRRGIVGWLKSMRSRSDSKRPRALHWDPKTIANAECVLWLLENAEHPDVTITALDAIQRLPPTLLYPLMLERGSLWDRMVSYHRSLLPHKPTSTHGAGWLKLWPDSAIISGMALCHVLKGRGPQDELLRTPLPYVGWSPSLGEDLSDPGVVARYAIACFLEMQPDDPSSSTLTLRRALETAIPKALSSSVLSIPLTDIRNSLVNQTFSTSVISLPLLLDSIILRTRRQEDMPSSYHFRRREEGEKVEALLQSLCVVLQNQPSRDIVSHVAITVAVVQWWNRSNPSSPFWSYPRPQNVKRFEEQVDDSLKEMDKGKYAADNIALAFSVIDATTSYSATLLYKTLLPIAEQISEDSGTGHTIHFSHFAPSLLRLAEQCTAHADTNHRIVRLLKKCGDGDWCTLPQDVRAIANLLGSALSLWRTPAESNMYTLVSGISLLHEMARRSDPARLREIIVTQGGLYQHRRAISRLNSALRSWAANASADFSGMALGLELDGAPDSPLLFSMQVELVVGILSLRYSGVNDALLDRSFKQVQRYFNQLMTNDANLRWPDYFAFLSLVSNGRLEPDDLDDTIFRSPSGVHNLGLNNYRLAVWRGEGILLLWRKARREHLNGELPGDWNDSAFFEAETVDTMLDYFEHTTSHPRHWFDQSTLVDYFERVRRIRWELQDEFRLSFGDEQREVVEKLAEQRPTRIDGVVNFLCHLGTLAGPVPRAP